jgi:phospho-N-acetylmuramoyl-pentapeptide-transferase
MGGLIILGGALASMLLSPLVANMPSAVSQGMPPLLLLIVGFGVIGFIDDFVVPRMPAGKRGLGWKQKLLMEIAVAAGAMAIGQSQEVWAIAVGTFLILFFSNAYNFSDGLDGLAGSLWIGLAVGLLLLNPGAAVAVTVIAILGGVVTFLFLNAPPAKVFMGDVGSLPIGAVLGYAVFTMLFPPTTSGFALDASALVPVAILSFVMMAELLPVPMQVAYFKATKGKRLFPMTPIHHAFEKQGWKETRVVWSFALVQLLLSLVAVSVYLAIGAQQSVQT